MKAENGDGVDIIKGVDGKHMNLSFRLLAIGRKKTNQHEEEIKSDVDREVEKT